MATASRRLLNEFKKLEKEKHKLSEDTRIYINWSQDDLKKATALIIGPTETPYCDGFYLFDCEFPDTYPSRPPSVLVCTSDNRARLHPNLYTHFGGKGKVCLSILGTWPGPSWSMTMQFTKVLISIQSLLGPNPITEEPAYQNYSFNHKDCVKYRKIITYENINVAIIRMLNMNQGQSQSQKSQVNGSSSSSSSASNPKAAAAPSVSSSSNLNTKFSFFLPIMRRCFLDNYDRIYTIMKSYESDEGKTETSPCYGFTVKYEVKKKLEELEKLKSEILLVEGDVEMVAEVVVDTNIKSNSSSSGTSGDKNCTKKESDNVTDTVTTSSTKDSDDHEKSNKNIEVNIDISNVLSSTAVSEKKRTNSMDVDSAEFLSPKSSDSDAGTPASKRSKKQ